MFENGQKIPKIERKSIISPKMRTLFMSRVRTVNSEIYYFKHFFIENGAKFKKIQIKWKISSKIAISAKIYGVSKSYELYLNKWFSLVKYFLPLNHVLSVRLNILEHLSC